MPPYRPIYAQPEGEWSPPGWTGDQPTILILTPAPTTSFPNSIFRTRWKEGFSTALPVKAGKRRSVPGWKNGTVTWAARPATHRDLLAFWKLGVDLFEKS